MSKEWRPFWFYWFVFWPITQGCGLLVLMAIRLMKGDWLMGNLIVPAVIAVLFAMGAWYWERYKDKA